MIDANVAVAIGALVVSVILMIWTIRKDTKGNDTNSASQITTVIVKLENIGNDISEIKKDLRSVKQDVRDHGERIAKAEQKIDALEKMIKHLHHEEDT